MLEAHAMMRKDNPGYEGVVDTCSMMKKLGKEVTLVEEILKLRRLKICIRSGR